MSIKTAQIIIETVQANERKLMIAIQSLCAFTVSRREDYQGFDSSKTLATLAVDTLGDNIAQLCCYDPAYQFTWNPMYLEVAELMDWEDAWQCVEVISLQVARSRELACNPDAWAIVYKDQLAAFEQIEQWIKSSLT